MYKKILVLLTAIILLFHISTQDHAHAITTKVATKVATQVFKESVKDIAKEKAFAMLLDEAGKIYDPKNKYKMIETHQAYCLEVTKPDGSCDRPVQIKKELTPDDQKKLDASVTKSMDNKLGNPLYATKFGKWLDWVVPIYAISAAGVVVDYAINQEDSVAGMMNEIAMDALQDSGIILPITTNEPTLTEANGLPIETAAEFTTEKVGLQTVTASIPFSTTKKLMNKTIMYQNDTNGNPANINATNAFVVNGGAHSWWGRSANTQGSVRLWTQFYYPSALEPKTTTLLKNGVVISQANRTSTDPNEYPFGSNGEWVVPKQLIPITEKFKTVIVQQTPSKTISTYTTFSGNVYAMEVPFYWNNDNMTALSSTVSSNDPNEQMATKITMYERTINLDFTPYEPIWLEEIEKMPVKPIEQSNFYNHEEKKFYFPPMDSVSYTDTATNEPVTIVKNPETGETSFTDGSGVPVHEDSISVMPGTGFTPAPDGGGMTYTPTNPTPENPTKEPVTVTPNQPVPPPPVEPPVDPNPLPDESGCEEKFKFPILSPLKETFSTAFPFSIPWDIERAINAAFSGIGHEKPKFNLDLNFLGQKETIEITTPKMFDDWKPFTDTLLVLTFDVLIMFGVYRFVKGAGS